MCEKPGFTDIKSMVNVFVYIEEPHFGAQILSRRHQMLTWSEGGSHLNAFKNFRGQCPRVLAFFHVCFSLRAWVAKHDF